MPKIVDHDAYRRELLTRSFDVFVRVGFSACTMRNLAQEIGVSTGTLYHYFKTKEDVFAQLVQQKADERKAAWADVAAMPPPLSARTLLTRLGNQALELRKLEVLRLEAERTMDDVSRVPRAQSLDDLCRVLEVQDRAVGELVYTVLVGTVFMPERPQPEFYDRIGTLLDGVIASSKARSD